MFIGLVWWAGRWSVLADLHLPNRRQSVCRIAAVLFAKVPDSVPSLTGPDRLAVASQRAGATVEGTAYVVPRVPQPPCMTTKPFRTSAFMRYRA